MDIPEIPIELTGNPFNVSWIKSVDIKRKMDRNLAWQTRLLIFYDKHKRLLISSKRRWLVISEEEYYSGKAMNYHSENQKLVKGMSEEEFFKVADSKCEKCKRSYVNLTVTNRRLIACTNCWKKFMNHQPDNQQIQWTKIDCHSHFLNFLDKEWKHRPDNVNLTETGLDLQIGYFIQTEKEFHACTRCKFIANGKIGKFCKFPCRCGKGSIVASCCDKWHPPIPCLLLERWTKLRGVLCCKKDGSPKKNADAIGPFIDEVYGPDGPETIPKDGKYDFSAVFSRVYQEYSVMHDKSLEDEKEARKHTRPNLSILEQTPLVVPNADPKDCFLKKALSILTKCRHFLMHIYIYQFYLEDPTNSGVSNGELLKLDIKVNDLSTELRKDLSAASTFHALESWVKKIKDATTQLHEDRKKLLDQIMKNGNFDFSVNIKKPEE